MENKLFEKTIIWNGDSICAGGKNAGSWASRIAEKNNMNYKNYAVSGGTVTEGVLGKKTGKLKHSVSATLDAMFEEYPDADYIILEGGANDATHLEESADAFRMGSVNPEDFSGEYDRATFCGALESVFYRSLKYWNGKKIGFIIPQKMLSLTWPRKRIRHYYEKAIEICKKWGIPYLDLWEECYLNPCLPWMYDSSKSKEENREENTGYYIDGQHMTSRGYDFTAEIVESWIRTL